MMIPSKFPERDEGRRHLAKEEESFKERNPITKVISHDLLAVREEELELILTEVFKEFTSDPEEIELAIRFVKESLDKFLNFNSDFTKFDFPFTIEDLPLSVYLNKRRKDDSNDQLIYFLKLDSEKAAAISRKFEVSLNNTQSYELSLNLRVNEPNLDSGLVHLDLRPFYEAIKSLGYIDKHVDGAKKEDDIVSFVEFLKRTFPHIEYGEREEIFFTDWEYGIYVSIALNLRKNRHSANHKSTDSWRIDPSSGVISAPRLGTDASEILRDREGQVVITAYNLIQQGRSPAKIPLETEAKRHRAKQILEEIRQEMFKRSIG